MIFQHIHTIGLGVPYFQTNPYLLDRWTHLQRMVRNFEARAAARWLIMFFSLAALVAKRTFFLHS